MAGLNEWSTVPGSNASIGSINLSEGQLPSTVNNSMRQVLADIAEVRDGTAFASGWHVKANGMGIHDQTDTTKKVIFDVSSVSSGSTRTIGFQNAAGTLAFLSDVPTSINSKAAETVPATGDLIPFYSASAGAERKITAANLLTVVNSLTEDTSPDLYNDFLLSYDTTASAVKKVKPDGLLTGTRELISTLTASSSASLAFTAFDSAKYCGYEFELVGIAPATDDARLYFRVSVDGGSNYRSTAGDYHYGGSLDADNATNAAINATSATEIYLVGIAASQGIGNASNEKLSGAVKLFAPDLGNTVLVNADTQWLNGNTNLLIAMITGRYKGTTDAVNGVQFIMSTGNIASGSIRCYGVRK